MNDAKIIIGDSRLMGEVKDESVELVVTSPPYWNIKDYGSDCQLGFGQSLHDYLKDLYRVWQECHRVLKEGRRLCVNIGDQFARAVVFGKYKIIPLHSEVIQQCEHIGYDFMGSIIWQKKTTMNTTGGATIMGSYPFPPNGLVEIDYEHILIFKKPGKPEKIDKEIKEKSKLTKEEWKEYFSGHWHFGGAKQVNHEAMFPEELPKRLIKMFTFVDETVLDPFLGSGTTALAALNLNRNAIAYEINKKFIREIKSKLMRFKETEFLNQKGKVVRKRIQYIPIIENRKPEINAENSEIKKEELYKVIEIVDESSIKLETGKIIEFLGVKIKNKRKTLEYLRKFILNKEVFLRPPIEQIDNSIVKANVRLKNKISINSYLVKSGLAKSENSD